MKPIFLLFTLTLASPCFAALSPYYDSLNQIETVLESDELSSLYGPVTSVERANELTYEVRTVHCVAQVVLKREIMNRPGPTKYSVESVPLLECE